MGSADGQAGYALTFVPTKIEVASAGDMAWEIGTFELRVNDAQGQPMEIPGKYVVTWRKFGPHGKWKRTYSTRISSSTGDANT